MLQFERRPLKWVLIIFTVEVIIALYVRDAIIRPYGGDVLAVILVYAALRVVVRLDAKVLAGVSLAIGVLVELGQLLRLSEHLGLSGSVVATTVLGTVFQWEDVACYALGALIAWLIDTRTSLFGQARSARHSG